jgi:hypothetical protein
VLTLRATRQVSIRVSSPLWVLSPGLLDEPTVRVREKHDVTPADEAPV